MQQVCLCVRAQAAAAVYTRLAGKLMGTYDDFENMGIVSHPTDTSAAMLHILAASSPPARWLVGIDAHVIGWAQRLLPTTLFDAMNRLILGISSPSY